MSEQQVDYRDLSREERHEVLHCLAQIAVDIITRHPNIRIQDVERLMVPRHCYGYMGWLAVRQAIKSGDILQHDDGHNTYLYRPYQSEVTSDTN